MRLVHIILATFTIVVTHGESKIERHRIIGDIIPNNKLEDCLANSIPRTNIYSKLSNSEKYHQLRFSQNNRLSRFPTTIVSVNNTSHISASIKCAKLHNITRITSRSGGHSYEAYSTCNDCLLIDLRYMDGLHVNTSNKEITAQPGLLLGHLNYQLWTNYKMGLPTGSCPFVGLGGFVLGGGYGFLSRKFGLLADNVVEFQMVNYKGDVIVANQTTNSDLYWANRGSGGGQFGIVTEVKMQGYDLRSGNVIYLSIHWDINYFKEVVFWFEKHIWSAPRQFGFELVVSAYYQFVEIKGYFMGPEAKLLRWMKTSQIRKIAPTLHETMYHLDYISYLLHAGFMPNDPDILKARFPHSPKSPFKHVSAFCKRPLSINMLSQLEEKLQILPWKKINKFGSGVFLIFAPFGGKIAELKDTDTAFPHRQGVRFMMQLGFYWTQGIQSKDNIDSILQWQRETRSIMMQDLEGAYQNYADSNLKDPHLDYYGVNLRRLKKIKSIHDPNNVFGFEQSIPIS